MRRYLICLFLLSGCTVIFQSCNKKTKGCTDARATNYNLSADEDDGSCIIAPDPLLGAYTYNGSRSGGSEGFISVTHKFSIVSVGDKKYKLTDLTGCAEIIVLSQGASFVLQSSDCEISNWTCFFSTQPGNSTLNFSKTVGSNFYNYNGKFTKL